jgi:aryl-alcohol dehydrogenase-like predicted oxidoreductase
MRYSRLGRSGLKVSRLCLGTMNFGKRVPEEECHAILDRAFELGINFIDTADVYGGVGNRGRTEEIIGRWFARDPARRNAVVLATKVCGKMGEGPNDARLSAFHIRRACEASLRRLQTDHLDLYQMHHIDRETPWDEIWQAMEQLVREGKITYVGSSNFAGWHIAQANCSAAGRNFLGLVSEQSIYNLTNRAVELEVVPACREFGLGLIPWSPLAGGLLGGMTAVEEASRRAGKEVQSLFKKHRERSEAYALLCSRAGLPPVDVALAWLLANPVVAAPIIGPRTVAQLEKAMPALDVTLPADFVHELADIWPGPGGEAPEAYAW